MKAIPRLTDLEVIIMKVLWGTEANLTIQEISGRIKEKKLSIASITQAINHLTAKNAVVVIDHVLVASVYARAYRPCFNREEYLAAEYKRLQKSVFGVEKANIAGIIASLLGSKENESISEEEANELKKMLNERKRPSKQDE